MAVDKQLESTASSVQMASVTSKSPWMTGVDAASIIDSEPSSYAGLDANKHHTLPSMSDRRRCDLSWYKEHLNRMSSFEIQYRNAQDGCGLATNSPLPSQSAHALLQQTLSTSPAAVAPPTRQPVASSTLRTLVLCSLICAVSPSTPTRPYCRASPATRTSMHHEDRDGDGMGSTPES